MTNHAYVTIEVHTYTRLAYLMIAFMTSMAQEAEQTKGSEAWSAVVATISRLWVRKRGKQPGSEREARQLNAL